MITKSGSWAFWVRKGFIKGKVATERAIFTNKAAKYNRDIKMPRYKPIRADIASIDAMTMSTMYKFI